VKLAHIIASKYENLLEEET